MFTQFCELHKQADKLLDLVRKLKLSFFFLSITMLSLTGDVRLGGYFGEQTGFNVPCRHRSGDGQAANRRAQGTSVCVFVFKYTMGISNIESRIIPFCNGLLTHFFIFTALLAGEAAVSYTTCVYITGFI